MNKIFSLVLISIFSLQDSVNLTGTYDVKYDKIFDPSGKMAFQLKVEKENYIKVIDNENIEGGITRIKSGERSLVYLHDFLFVNPGIPTDSLRHLKLGKVVMEIEEMNSDTLDFRTTYMNQLQITINKGKLFRKY